MELKITTNIDLNVYFPHLPRKLRVEIETFIAELIGANPKLKVSKNMTQPAPSGRFCLTGKLSTRVGSQAHKLLLELNRKFSEQGTDGWFSGDQFSKVLFDTLGTSRTKGWMYDLIKQGFVKVVK